MRQKKPTVSKSKKGSAKPVKSRRTAPRESPFVREIVTILDDQKATDIRAIPLDNHLADSFVLATAAGVRHLHSLAEHLLQKMTELGVRAHHIEGYGGAAPSDRWVLVDFAETVVHLFTEEGRKYFNLDRLLEEKSE